MKDSGSCKCGNLFVDFDAFRFGATMGDKSIEVYIVKKD